MKNKYTPESDAICNHFESICNANLSFLTGQTGCLWFSTMTGNPEKSRIDYNFTTNNKTGNQTGKLELKTRKCRVDQYSFGNKISTVYIEPDKFTALKDSKTDKKWYLNFFENDKNKFWMVDIDQFEENELESFLVEKLWDNAHEEYTSDYRLLIPINKGKYYEFNHLTNAYEEKTYNEITKKFNR